MPRVLVTGVAGFIGSHIAEHCLQAGYEVVGADDLSTGFLDNVPTGVDFRRGSIIDRAWVQSLWGGRGFDFVYHLAAFAAEGRSHFVRYHNYASNIIGSTNLINEAIRGRVKCFVFVSSIAVYGFAEPPLVESQATVPVDPYGIAKHAVELDLKAAALTFGLPHIIFRAHNVYGERQSLSDPSRNVVGIFMAQGLRKEPFTLYGTGLQTRAFSYIGDVAPIVATSPSVPAAYNQVINVGSDNTCSVRELSEAVARVLRVPHTVTHRPARQEVLHTFASHDKLQSIFTVGPPTELDFGLRIMAKWAESVADRPLSRLPALEVPEGLALPLA